MQYSFKLWLILSLTAVAAVLVFLLPPIPQSEAFHNFADKRELGDIPNFFNVVSNLSFLLVGIYGFSLLRKSKASFTIYLLFAVLFLGILLTAIGSAFYHLNPNNNTLVWDRIPMTIIFMAFTALSIAESIDPQIGFNLLFPLLFLGIGSVLWWHYTEYLGHGDLRVYFFVQFYPMIITPVIMLLYYTPAHKTSFRYLGIILIWYIVAKLLEHFDQPIYNYTGISGHTLKHLAAAVSTLYFVLLFRKKYTSRKKHLQTAFPQMLDSMDRV